MIISFVIPPLSKLSISNIWQLLRDATLAKLALQTSSKESWTSPSGDAATCLAHVETKLIK